MFVPRDRVQSLFSGLTSLWYISFHLVLTREYRVKMSEEDHILQGPTNNIEIPRVGLGEYFYNILQQHGDNIAQIQQVDGVEISISYVDLLRNSKIVSGLLREHNLQVGQTVMLLCGNTLDYAPIMLGTLFVGATLSPINPGFDQSDFLHLLYTIQPSVIIFNKLSEHNIKEAVDKYNGEILLISLETVNRYFLEKKGVQDFYLGKVDDPDSDVAFVMCSSGTSGKPKGVEMVHSRIIYLILNLKLMPIGDDPYAEVGLNLSGPYWESCRLLTSLYFKHGIKMILLEKFSVPAFLDIIQKYKVNFTVCGPDILIALAKYPSLSNYDLSSLRGIAYGGSSISRSLLDLAHSTLKHKVTVAYGMTENMSLNLCFDNVDKPCNVGRLIPGVLSKVVDIVSGKALGPNLEGEICFKSPACFKGYRGNPEATASMFDKDGFLHTGDIGYYDNDRYFYVVDRLKELIKYRGNHVPAIDIEEVLLQHSDVVEAAVIGVFHETDWEHATAIVVIKPGGKVNEQDLVYLVQENLPTLKWLYGGVHFVDSLPKTPSGKIQKHMLRKIYSKTPE